MSINLLPADTLSYSSFVSQDLLARVQAAYASGNLSSIDVRLAHFDEGAFKIHLIIGGNTPSDVIAPYIKQPVAITTPNGKKEVVVDLRDFGRWHAPTARFNITSRNDYAWALKRAVLTHIWINGGIDKLRGLSTMPAALYASLISETVTRRFMLDKRETQIISILSMYFYYCLFSNEAVFNEIAFNKVAALITRITRLPAEMVYETIEGLGVLADLRALCDAIKERTFNISLENFNLTTFTALINNNWLGNAGRLTMMVGMEHVPTWIALSHSAMGDASYNRTTLTKLAQTTIKRAEADQFVKALNYELSGFTVNFNVER